MAHDHAVDDAVAAPPSSPTFTYHYPDGRVVEVAVAPPLPEWFDDITAGDTITLLVLGVTDNGAARGAREAAASED